MMYDLKDDKTLYYLYGLAIRNKPIDFYGFNLYIPLVTDIFDMNRSKEEMNYNSKLHIMLCETSCYVGKETENNLSVLEYIYEQNKTIEQLSQLSIEMPKTFYLKEKLIDSISYFFRINKDKVILDKLELENEKPFLALTEKEKMLFLDNDKFEELRELICLVTNTKKISYKDLCQDDNFDKKVKSSDERLNKRLQEFYKGREDYRNKVEKVQREKQAKIIEFYNVYSYVANVRGYDVTEKYNIFQLSNAYEYINANIIFNYEVGIATSGFASEQFKLEDIKLKIVK